MTEVDPVPMVPLESVIAIAKFDVLVSPWMVSAGENVVHAVVEENNPAHPHPSTRQPPEVVSLTLGVVMVVPLPVSVEKLFVCQGLEVFVPLYAEQTSSVADVNPMARVPDQGALAITRRRLVYEFEVVELSWVDQPAGTVIVVPEGPAAATTSSVPVVDPVGAVAVLVPVVGVPTTPIAISIPAYCCNLSNRCCHWPNKSKVL